MKTRKISISIFQIFITLIIIVAIIIGILIVMRVIKKENGQSIFAGSGTLEDPYRIENVEDLVALAQSVNKGEHYKDKYFSLLNKLDFQDDTCYKNIDDTSFGDINQDGKIETIKIELQSGFTPIGGKYLQDNTISSFEGIFNGNDKTIKNLVLNISSSEQGSFVGLFGNNKGEISSLRIMGEINISENLGNQTLYVGMIAGKNEGKIQTCRVEGAITANINDNNTYAEIAGIAGENIGEISDSASNVNIISNQLKAGITAKNIKDTNILNSGKITNCTNTGSIKEEQSTNNYTAGIVAENQNGSITSCTNDGDIQGKLAAGIIGRAIECTIAACQNNGNITNLKENSTNSEIAGGIVALLEKSIMENCKNTGTISGLTDVGGIVGINSGSISQSRNEGNITKINETIASKINLGGIVGSNYSDGKILNSKNYGTISSTYDNLVTLGGISGKQYSGALIDSCENSGNLVGEGKIITPNEDTTVNCKDCINYAGGSAQTKEAGELHLGLIYGKFETTI
ncbi:MAG: hypothetical protein ACI4VQ_02210 [Clostridia bacterium]